jgi:hypothetical protein
MDTCFSGEPVDYASIPIYAYEGPSQDGRMRETAIIMESAGHGAWANIVVDADDQEVAAIDRLSRTLGELPGEVVTVRELISRFEICHYAFPQNLKQAIRAMDVSRVPWKSLAP